MESTSLFRDNTEGLITIVKGIINKFGFMVVIKLPEEKVEAFITTASYRIATCHNLQEDSLGSP